MDRTIAHALVLLLALVATVGVFAGAAGEGSAPEPAARPTAEMGRFNEAPALASKVAAGELPPVDERLPIEPLVITPTEEIGQYGGTWHTLVGTSSETKWLNIYAYERLMRWDAEAKEVIPNIATSWTISQGGKVFTFQLREGMKWSDGHPFSADDIVFWYEDMVLNEELTPRFPGYLSVAGERGRVEKVDDYTVQFRIHKTEWALLLLHTWRVGFPGSGALPPAVSPQVHVSRRIRRAGKGGRSGALVSAIAKKELVSAAESRPTNAACLDSDDAAAISTISLSAQSLLLEDRHRWKSTALHRRSRRRYRCRLRSSQPQDYGR